MITTKSNNNSLTGVNLWKPSLIDRRSQVLIKFYVVFHDCPGQANWESGNTTNKRLQEKLFINYVWVDIIPDGISSGAIPRTWDDIGERNWIRMWNIGKFSVQENLLNHTFVRHNTEFMKKIPWNVGSFCKYFIDKMYMKNINSFVFLYFLINL